MTQEPCSKKAKLDTPDEPKDEEVTDTSIEKRFHMRCYTENSSDAINLKPIKCIIKHRFSDFIVNEIDERKEVVRLTSFNLPENEGDQETEDIADIGQVLSEKEQSVVTEVVKNRNRLWIKLTEAPEDKNRRKVIHTFISNKFNNVITKTEDGFISVKFSPGQKDKRGRSPRVAWDNSKLGGKFCCFVLYKEGLSTVEAIDSISSKLHKPTSCFTFGGTKDKRGITTQRVTAFKVFASELAYINGKLDKVKVGNFSYTNTRLGLGALIGNRFQLFLRGINKHDVPILTQRAGTIKVSSEDFYRMKFGVEKKFLIGLQKCGSDSDKKICDAFSFVSRPMRTMYLHAYQAYLWNMIASERINQFGLNLCVGDLVLSCSGEVITIDEENLTQYSIFDCVIPVLGSNSQLPPNLKEFCLQALEQDSMDQSNFKHKIKDYSMPGDYRKLLIKPENFAFSFLSYNKSDEDVMKSDLQLMYGGSEESQNCETSAEYEGKFLGLKLSFDLPKSAYATMLVREITFCDTSQQFNKKESDYLNAENSQ